MPARADARPGVAAPATTLGLAYALAGDLTAARESFARAGDRAAALYNIGIVHLAARQWADGVDATFLDALAGRPERCAIGGAARAPGLDA